MRVLLLSHHFFPVTGGIESYTLGLAKALKENGIECSVVCLNKDPFTGKKLPAEEIVEGIAVKRVSFIDLGFYKIAFGLLKEIKKADLVHVQNIGFLSDFALLTKGIHKKPVVISTHGGITHTKERGFLKGIYSKWLEIILDKANFVIADSMQDFAQFESIANNIKIIENGVELEEFLALQRKTRKGSIIFVGRLSKNKGIEKLIEAFSIVLKQNPETMLRIVGKDFDNILKQLQDKTIELDVSNRVFFKDNIERQELLFLLSESEFFASASETEGFGISAVEAMAAGCIPILNNIEAFHSFVEEKINGFIADFSNPEEAAKTILSAMAITEEEKNNISAAARKSVEKYSWKNKSKEIIEVYKGVL